MAKTRLCGNQWMSLWQTESGALVMHGGDGATIVPLNAAGEVLLITEPSVAYDGMRSLLLPGGAIDEGEDPLEAANRELQEELGYKSARLDALGAVYTSVKYVKEKIHIILARDLVASDLAGDEPDGWIIAQEPVALSDIEALIVAGRLVNATTIAALFMARSFLEKEATSAGV